MVLWKQSVKASDGAPVTRSLTSKRSWKKRPHRGLLALKVTPCHGRCCCLRRSVQEHHFEESGECRRRWVAVCITSGLGDGSGTHMRNPLDETTMCTVVDNLARFEEAADEENLNLSRRIVRQCGDGPWQAAKVQIPHGEEVYMPSLLSKLTYAKELLVKFGRGILVCKLIASGVRSLGGGLEVVHSVISSDKLDVMLSFSFKGSLHSSWLNNNNVNNNPTVEVMFSGVKVDPMLISTTLHDEAPLCHLLRIS